MKCLSTELLSSERNWKKTIVLLRIDLNLSASELEYINKFNKKLQNDLNTTINNQSISRVDVIIPTIRALLKKNAKIIILSHFQRPRGKTITSMSLYNLFKDIRAYLHAMLYNECRITEEDIKFMHTFNADAVCNKFKSETKILMLENLRFSPEEEKNGKAFAKELAKMGDIYVNEAFSCSHRKHASIHAITEFLPSFAGLYLESEVKSLQQSLSKQSRPRLAIIGGSKVSTKLNTLIGVGAKVENLLIAGAMANTFLVAKGYSVGASFYEPEYVQEAKNILKSSIALKLILPIDVMVSSKSGSVMAVNIESVPADTVIQDIGPKTIDFFRKKIILAHSIIWNGPVGVFEKKEFSNGCIVMAMTICSAYAKGAVVVIGGGDTLSAISAVLFSAANHKYNKNGIMHLSTAGGAFLEWLEGKLLPGISALNSNLQQ
ncbi:Phosphoglycerate kinase [Candidatus Xenohaliotis californiensis]|uniref:Phosphoglycerate kinase n=1 Tax=Candidatus Xenohaliotis californiensis TaxID=84677 RepID=A0ABM9N9D4_9RICK|nr:Phosphoglycerate kinase [Candidatus Xenohaliotis californiensis]